MEIDTITTVLIALCPTITAVITAIIGFLSLIRTIKSLRNSNNETVIRSNQNVERMDRKLSLLNTKIASIEQYLLEQKEKRKWKKLELGSCLN